MDLMYLLHALLRKKWIIIFCTVLGLVAGFVFTLVKPKMYVSLAQYSTGFTMEQKVKIKQEETFNIYEIDLRFNNVIETFKSPKVIGMLSYKLLLHDLEDSSPFRKLTEEQKNKNTAALVNLDRTKQLLRSHIAEMELLSGYVPDEKKALDLIALYGYDVDNLAGNLNFDRVQRTDFINIFFRSENPELSAYVVNTIGTQFIRFFNSIYGLRTQESTAKLDSLASAKKREVDSLNAKLKIYRDKIGTPNVADRASAAMTVVQELTSNYNQEQAKLNNLRGELSAVQQQLGEMGTSGLTSGTNNNVEIRSLFNKNAELELDKNGRTEDEIEKLQAQIEANLKRIQTLNSGNSGIGERARTQERTQAKRDNLLNRKIELQQQIAASETNVRLFSDQKRKYEDITSSGGGEEVILRAKEDELRMASQEYDQLRKGLQSSLDLNVNPENNFKQTMAGIPAYQPEPARRTLILGLSGMVMLFLSAFLIVGLEFLDTSFKTISAFRRTTQTKLLGALNKVDLTKKSLADYFRPGEELGDDGRIFLENLRKLRFEIETSGKKTFLVTSTQPRQGKTVLIEALANSLSLSKKKLLLIDANFSNNTLTQKFDAKPTLEQFSLQGQQNALDKFYSTTSMTTIPNTDMIGCAQAGYTPSEILPKNNLLEHLPTIAENYDFIFIEGANLNNHADSKELSKYVDGIIAVFSARSSLRPSDKDAVKFMEGTGRFTGTVLNLVEKENLDL